MLASQNLAVESIGEKNNTDINLSPTKVPKFNKRTLRSANSNGVMENGNGSLSETIPSRLSKHSDTKKVNESTDRNTYQLEKTLTPVESAPSTITNNDEAQNFHQIELTAVTDEDNDDDEREQRIGLPLANLNISDHDTMVSSYTTGGGDNDIIEIHEFSLADIDAYLEIYFETLNNRLRSFIGENDQLEQFRLATKNRINSDLNSREYQNVLLGKMNGEVVAAVTLSFPEEATTVSNDQILPQANSCVTSIRRWITRNANYVPMNMEECYIEMIGVKSAFRNSGIGAAMLECVEHFAQQAGALLLTVHTNSEQLRNYFLRFGFVIDHFDSSAYWKWAIERQSITKMSKIISPVYENGEQPMDNASGHVNESMVGSANE